MFIAINKCLYINGSIQTKEKTIKYLYIYDVINNCML